MGIVEDRLIRRFKYYYKEYMEDQEVEEARVREAEEKKDKEPSIANHPNFITITPPNPQVETPNYLMTLWYSTARKSRSNISITWTDKNNWRYRTKGLRIGGS
jgi:hypothetical protein